MHIVEVGLHSSGGSSDCIVGLFLSAPNQPNLLRINSGVEGFWIIFLRLKLRRKKQVFQEEYFKRSWKGEESRYYSVVSGSLLKILSRKLAY